MKLVEYVLRGLGVVFIFILAPLQFYFAFIWTTPTHNASSLLFTGFVSFTTGCYLILPKHLTGD